MPELPDITVYVAALERTVVGSPLVDVRVASPFLLRSVDPPLAAVRGRTVTGADRLGKRIVLALEGELYLVLHLMIAGRLRWRSVGVVVPRKVGLAAFDFPQGSILLTEASTKKRASLYVVAGAAGLAAHNPGGLEVLTSTPREFAAALRLESHTLKRALTDPSLFSGIGNAYSDEILHRARMSPFKRSSDMSDAEVAALHAATIAVLTEWTARLMAEAEGGFPEKVTAFHEGMAVHGRYRQPCPDCGAPVQRVVYAENEMNYCAACQTGGKLMADRSLSRLLKDDWPRTVEELEARRRAAAQGAIEG